MLEQSTDVLARLISPVLAENLGQAVVIENKGGAGGSIGAAVAALLPRTQAEDETLGAASDAVKKAVGETAQTGLDKAKAVAGEVAEDARQAAQREGLSPEAAVRSVTEKLEP